MFSMQSHQNFETFILPPKKFPKLLWHPQMWSQWCSCKFCPILWGYLLFFLVFLLLVIEWDRWHGDRQLLWLLLPRLSAEVPGSFIMPDHNELRLTFRLWRKKIPFLLITKHSSFPTLSEVSCKYLTESYEQHSSVSPLKIPHLH